MKDLARVFKALADPTRLGLMALLLAEGELCVCECEQALGISQSKASRHLRYLAQAGLVADRRVGAWVHYRVAEGLDADRAAVVELARSLLAGARSDEVLAALERRRAAGRSDGEGCAPALDGGQPA